MSYTGDYDIKKWLCVLIFAVHRIFQKHYPLNTYSVSRTTSHFYSCFLRPKSCVLSMWTSRKIRKIHRCYCAKAFNNAKWKGSWIEYSAWCVTTLWTTNTHQSESATLLTSSGAGRLWQPWPWPWPWRRRCGARATQAGGSAPTGQVIPAPTGSGAIRAAVGLRGKRAWRGAMLPRAEWAAGSPEEAPWRRDGSSQEGDWASAEGNGAAQADHQEMKR